MTKALLTFSDGSTLQIKNNQVLVPIVSYKLGDRFIVSHDKLYKLSDNINDGLVAALCEFLANCHFFKLLDDSSVVYNSTSVIKIESL